jgi:transcriptional regulator with XRE-family HTH domain
MRIRETTSTTAPTPAERRLGERIAEARRAVGLTQTQLADEIGASLWSVESLEQGRGDVERHLEAIAHATIKPVRWFYRLADAEPTFLADAPAAVPSLGWRAADYLAEVRAAAEERGRAGLRRLLLGSIALLVLVRFFTEGVPILPAFATFTDVLVFFVLVAVAVGRRPDVPSELTKAPFITPVLLFLCLCVFSALVNLSRVAPGPVLLFLYNFLGPLGVYYATARLWPIGNTRSISRLLVSLGIVQFAVVLFVDLPRFVSTRNPDEISGTFGFNPYQLVFYLIVFASLVAGIATFEPKRRTARLAPVLIGASFVVIFLAQYRALLITTALSALAVGFLLRSRGRGLIIGTFVVVALIGALAYVSSRFPVTKYEPAVVALRTQPTTFTSARLGAAGDVVKLYGDDPRFIVTGTGPGTYSSRAWRTFALLYNTSRTDTSGPYVSALTGGAYRTDVSTRYVLPRYAHAEAIFGSKVLSAPFSSYLALLAEVGVGGFILIVGLYVGALLRAGRLLQTAIRKAVPGDPLPAVLLACVIGFFVLLQMAVLENWWEATRVTFPVWMLLAIGQKELEARTPWLR